MEDNGDEKLLAMARHIAKTLGRSDTMTDDILQIFSNFDGRFSKMADSPAPGVVAGNLHRAPTAAAIEQALRSLDRRISRFVAADRPLWSDSADSAAFLDAVDGLLALLRESSEERPLAPAGLLSRAEDLLQQAMFRLQDEFRALMERGGESLDSLGATVARTESYSDSEEDDDGDRVIPVANPISDYDFIIDALPSGTVADLHDIAKRMVAAGYGKECGHVYGGCRREFLEESLSRLGLERRSIDEVQKTPWPQLEDDIEKWVKAANMALKVFFPSERRLVDRVFGGISSPHPVADATYMEVCRGAAIQILNFADAVAIGSRAPERLFRVLDLFETMRDLMPDFNLVFSDHYCASLRAEAATIWKRLGEAIRGVFMELENLIRRDPAKAAIPGGGLHPITRYVMNYLRAACGSQQTLEQVLCGRAADGELFDNVDAGAGAGASSLGVEISWIMELLESNLEAKSKIYSDPAQSAVFLMNNNRYIVHKARDSDLGAVLGEDWVRKHAAKVRQYHTVYIRTAWGRVLAPLKFDSGSRHGSGSGGSSNADTGKTGRDRLKQFNSGLEEVCRGQREWVVADGQLREELRIAVVEALLPAYRSFLRRLQGMGDGGGRHVKYSEEDVEMKLNELFQGRK